MELGWASLIAPAVAFVLSVLYAAGWCITVRLTRREFFKVLSAKWIWIVVLGLFDGVRALVIATLTGLGVLDFLPEDVHPPVWGTAGAWALVGVLSFFIGFRVPPAVSFHELPEKMGEAQSPDDDSRPTTSQLTTLLYRPSTGIVRRIRHRCVREIIDGVAQVRSRDVATGFRDLAERIVASFGVDVGRNAVMSAVYQVRVTLEYSKNALAEQVVTSLCDYLDVLEYDLDHPVMDMDYRGTLEALLERLLKDDLPRLVDDILGLEASPSPAPAA